MWKWIQVLRIAVLVSIAVVSSPVFAKVELQRGFYHTDVEDLSVKAMGGHVKILRTWYRGDWYFTRAWAPLKLMLAGCSRTIFATHEKQNNDSLAGVDDSDVENVYSYVGGEHEESGDAARRDWVSVIASFFIKGAHAHTVWLGRAIGIDKTCQIVRNGDTYRYANGKLFVYDNKYTIEVIRDAARPSERFVWRDREGNWIVYDAQGKVLRYGDSNNVQVSFAYDANGRRTGVMDNNGDQVLWYEYDAEGRISTIRDNADPAMARIVRYQWNGSQLVQVVDVNGGVTSYQYRRQFPDNPRTRDNDLLISITDPEGRTRRIEYVSGGRVAKVIASDGTSITYEYDYDKTTKQYFTRQTYSTGKVVEMFYLASGDVVRKDINGVTIETLVLGIEKNNDEKVIKTKRYRNELGQVTVKKYDEWENLIQVIYPDNTFVSYIYDVESGRLLEETNENGVKARYEYDSAGNLMRKIEAAGQPEQRVTEYTYDSYGNRLTARRLADALSEETLTTYTYDAAGNIKTRTTRIDSSNSVTVNFDRYDNMGNLLAWRDGRGNAWQQTFDAAGNKTSVTDPLSNTTRYAYDGAGNLISVTDPAGNVTRYAYNTQAQLDHITDAASAIKRYIYNDKGQLVTVLDEEEHPSQRRYDSQGRLSQLIDGAGNTITIRYGVEKSRNVTFNRLAAIDYPTYRQEMGYDRRGRLATSRDILDASTAYLTRREYDATGNLVAVTDAAGKTTRYAYDGLNRLVQVTQPDGSTVQYQYDNRDNLLAVTNEKGIVIRRYAYDGKDRLIRETWPTGQVHRYAYDANDNLIEKTDAKGQVTRYTYDAANRLTQIAYYPTSSATTAGKTVTFTYDATGRLTGYADGQTSAVYTYDALGRKLTETLDFGAFTARLGYTWYKNGKPANFTEPTGTPVTYTWDAANRLAQVRLPGEGAIVWNRYTWNAPAQITYPGGATRHIAHDPLLRIRQLTARDPAANAVLDYRYEYDPVGNITRKATEHGTYTYEYDPRDRLTRATNPTLPDEAWTYDPAGNRTSDASLPGPWQYDDANALTAYSNVTFSHDANGSTIRKIVAGQATTYVYNLENRLSEVRDNSGATVATYGYDPFGRRLWKEVGGNRTYFVYSEEGLVAELDASGAVVQSYGYVPQSAYGTAPLYTRTSAGYAYYQLDHLGTPQVLVDKSGKVVWQGRARAFGETAEIVSEVSNPLRFPGQYKDQETGLYYNYFRYYDPETGRYVTSDPIGLRGGLNDYLYVEFNPIHYIDPIGLCRRGYVPMEGNPNTCEPTNLVKPDRCATAECAANMQPAKVEPLIPPDVDAKCYADCKLKNAAICSAMSAGGSGVGRTVGAIASIPSEGAAAPVTMAIGNVIGGGVGYGICKISMTVDCNKKCKKYSCPLE